MGEMHHKSVVKVDLASKGFWALATLNVNRSRKCPLLKETELKKGQRGASTINVNKEKSVVVTSSYHSKRVLMISCFVGKCTQYIRKEKGTASVERPAPVVTSDMLTHLTCWPYLAQNKGLESGTRELHCTGQVNVQLMHGLYAERWED